MLHFGFSYLPRGSSAVHVLSEIRDHVNTYVLQYTYSTQEQEKILSSTLVVAHSSTTITILFHYSE